MSYSRGTRGSDDSYYYARNDRDRFSSLTTDPRLTAVPGRYSSDWGTRRYRREDYGLGDDDYYGSSRSRYRSSAYDSYDRDRTAVPGRSSSLYADSDRYGSSRRSRYESDMYDSYDRDRSGYTGRSSRYNDNDRYYGYDDRYGRSSSRYDGSR